MYKVDILQKEGRNRDLILSAIKNHPDFSVGEIKHHLVMFQMTETAYNAALNSLLTEGIIVFDTNDGLKIVDCGGERPS